MWERQPDLMILDDNLGGSVYFNRSRRYAGFLGLGSGAFGVVSSF
jgi:hypothetical protein